MTFRFFRGRQRNHGSRVLYSVAQQPPADLGFVGKWLIIIGAVVIVFILLNTGKNIYTEWLWFDSLGFSSIYLTILRTQVILFLIGAIVFFAILMASIVVAQRLSPKNGGTLVMGGEEIVVPRRTINIAIIVVSVVLSLIFGSLVSGQWDPILRFLNANPFGQSDPIFGKDVAFYVFNLPVYRFLQQWIVWGLFLILVGTASIYGLSYALNRYSFAFTRAMKGHLSALGAAILALFAWGYWLNTFELLYSPRGLVFGASYTDTHAQLLALRLLIAVGAACALLLVANIFLGGVRLPLFGIGAWIIIAVLVGNIYPAIVQRFQVEPNELVKETPYINHNIRLTRQAFALDRIEEKPFSAEEILGLEAIQANPDTINNIRLWDHRPLKNTYNQIQSIRLYYDFHDVDVDRYTIDGQYRQVMLGARELSPEKLASEAQTWVNQRLQFTHGYGVALSPVTESDKEGLPVLLVKDVPPIGDIKIERPEIYYGEKTTNYVIVNTKELEFDYPKGETNVYSTYAGESGVVLSSYLRKLAYAWQFGDVNIMLNDDLTLESRLLYYRTIGERVEHLAHFLLLDDDPYLVIMDGKLFWIQDAYTTTDKYPYSQPYEENFNYIRNSVKAVIDAYDGSVRFYVADPTDAIIQTYEAIFPDLFTPMAEMPSSLKAHLRYPEDLFLIQSEMYQTYHMQDPKVFYNKEDTWTRPNELYYGAEQPMEAYYVIMRLPEEETEEFLLMIPFTPFDKNNTIAWLAASCDGDKYGKLLAYLFPKEKLIYGPMQFEALVSQKTEIAEQLALWGRGGATVIRGNTLMIPISDSILFVEPVYLQSEAGQIPQLQAVIVGSGDRLAMRDTLQESLAAIFGAPLPPVVSPPTVPTVPTTPSDIAALAVSAQEHYNKAQEYLKAGDWAGYGRELAALENDLRRLIELTSGVEE